MVWRRDLEISSAKRPWSSRCSFPPYKRNHSVTRFSTKSNLHLCYKSPPMPSRSATSWAPPSSLEGPLKPPGAAPTPHLGWKPTGASHRRRQAWRRRAPHRKTKLPPPCAHRTLGKNVPFCCTILSSLALHLQPWSGRAAELRWARTAPPPLAGRVALSCPLLR
jgi:hypothetical protein